MTGMHLEMVWNSDKSSRLKVDLWNYQFLSNM